MQLLLNLKSLTECADGSLHQALGSPAGLKDLSAYKRCGARLSGVCTDRGGKGWEEVLEKQKLTHTHNKNNQEDVLSNYTLRDVR